MNKIFKLVFKLLFLFGVVCVLGIELVYQWNTNTDIEPHRQKNEMQMLELTYGKTYYQFHGDKKDPLLVLVHGFSVHHVAFDNMIDDLLAAGYCVLTFDSVGRGLSDKPRIHYTPDVYIQQIDDLFNELDIQTTPKVLVGYSLGALISVLYTNSNPEHITTNILIAPGGMYYKPPSKVMRTFPIWITERILFFTTGSYKEKIATADPIIAQKVFQQMQFPGFYHALVSTIKHGTRDFQKDYLQFSQRQNPILFIWGRQDEVVSYENSKEMLKNFTDQELFIVEDGNHMIPLSHPQKVTSKITGFLSSKEIFPNSTDNEHKSKIKMNQDHSELK